MRTIFARRHDYDPTSGRSTRGGRRIDAGEGSVLILAGPIVAADHQLRDHPERPGRVTAAMDGVDDLALGSDLVSVEVRPASRDDLLRVHDETYLDDLETLARRGGGPLDPDTYVTERSWDLACLAAGAGLAAVSALRQHGEGVGFVAARPPGHHAEAGKGMGFCLLNNVAIAAASLARSGERVAVIDWDVHHGNGTQDIFWDVPEVLYVSTHQWPLYPGTGRPSEVGGRRATGSTLNLPVPPGATGDVLRLAIDEVAAPVIEAFRPDWVLVSCGFDAHRADPLAGLTLSSADFAAIAGSVASFPPSPGRLALFLEGGYDLGSVRRSTAATLGGLLGVASTASALGEPEAPTAGGPGADTVRAAAAARTQAIESAG